jgi:drug/metabolite transporter (DMT)-like permease
MSRDSLKTIAAYLTIYIVWGSAYFFIKMALESFPPYPIVGVRFTLGGILLLALGLASSKTRVRFSLALVLSAMLLGMLLLLGANGLATMLYGETPLRLPRIRVEGKSSSIPPE